MSGLAFPFPSSGYTSHQLYSEQILWKFIASVSAKLLKEIFITLPIKMCSLKLSFDHFYAVHDDLSPPNIHNKSENIGSLNLSPFHSNFIGNEKSLRNAREVKESISGTRRSLPMAPAIHLPTFELLVRTIYFENIPAHSAHKLWRSSY